MELFISLHVLLAQGWSHLVWTITILVHTLHLPPSPLCYLLLAVLFLLKYEKWKNFLSSSSSLSTQFLYKSSAKQSFLMEKNHLPTLATAPLQPPSCKRHSRQQVQDIVPLLSSMSKSGKKEAVGRLLKRGMGSLWGEQSHPAGGNC